MILNIGIPFFAGWLAFSSLVTWASMKPGTILYEKLKGSPLKVLDYISFIFTWLPITIFAILLVFYKLISGTTRKKR